MWTTEAPVPLATAARAAVECGVRVVSDYDSFLALEPVWNSLAEEARAGHPFLRHEWVRSWWECFGEGKDLHILLVSVGDEIIAIAPLMLSQRRMYGLKVRQLEFIQNDQTPQFDFIIPRHSEEAYRAIWRAIVARRRFWDVLVLPNLPAGSRTLQELARFAAQDGFRAGFRRSKEGPYVQFSGEWESYVNGLSRNLRTNVRKAFNRLTRHGRVQLEMISSREQVAGALNDALRIEAASWKGKVGIGISTRPEVQRFYTVLAERTAQLGALRLVFLTAGRVRIAFAYALCYRNRLYALKGAHDSSYGRYSPFNLLCYLVFREGFKRGLAEFDFCGKKDEWMLRWTKQTARYSWLFVFPSSPRMRLLFHAKCRLVPTLRRWRLFRFLRDAVLGRAFE